MLKYISSPTHIKQRESQLFAQACAKYILIHFIVLFAAVPEKLDF